jgi:hypothetical protein
MSDIKISKETIETIKKIANQFDKPIDVVRKEYGVFIRSPILAERPDREEQALRMLKAKFVSEFDQPTQQYEVYVIDKAKPVTITTKTGKNAGKKMTIANVYGLAINPNEPNKKIRFAKIAHFDQNAAKVNDVEIGKFFKVKLTGGIEGKHFRLAAAQSTTWTPDEDDIPESFKDPTTIIRNEFEMVDIAEGSLKIGNEGLFLVEGQVTSVRVVPKRSGDGSLGIYKIADSSIQDDKALAEEMRGGMTVFTDPDQVKCGWLSTVLVLGRFSMNEDKGVVQMNGELVIPIISMPLEMKPEEDATEKSTGLTEENSEQTILKDEEL